MGTIITCSVIAFILGVVTGALIIRRHAGRWVEAMAESREELLERMTAEFGEETIERIVGKMIMDLLNEKK